MVAGRVGLLVVWMVVCDKLVRDKRKEKGLQSRNTNNKQTERLTDRCIDIRTVKVAHWVAYLVEY